MVISPACNCCCNCIFGEVAGVKIPRLSNFVICGTTIFSVLICLPSELFLFPEDVEEQELELDELIKCGFDLIVTRLIEFLRDVGETMLVLFKLPVVPELSVVAKICVEFNDDNDEDGVEDTELSERSDEFEFE